MLQRRYGAGAPQPQSPPSANRCEEAHHSSIGLADITVQDRLITRKVDSFIETQIISPIMGESSTEAATQPQAASSAIADQHSNSSPAPSTPMNSLRLNTFALLLEKF